MVLEVLPWSLAARVDANVAEFLKADNAEDAVHLALVLQEPMQTRAIDKAVRDYDLSASGLNDILKKLAVDKDAADKVRLDNSALIKKLGKK